MTNLEIAFHGTQTVVMVLIFLGIADKHTVWVRLKDRVNTMWAKHCEATDQVYVPLDNGKK